MTLMHYERDETTRAHAEKHLVTQVVYAKTERLSYRRFFRFYSPLTMVGTFPRFYKIKATAYLDHCVRFGQYFETQTFIATLLEYRRGVAVTG